LSIADSALPTSTGSEAGAIKSTSAVAAMSAAFVGSSVATARIAEVSIVTSTETAG